MLRQPKETLYTLSKADVTASGSDVIVLPKGDFDSVLVELNVSAASGTTPTLDLYAQTTIDGGSNYLDAVRFAQITTTTSNKHYAIISIPRNSAVIGAVGDATISASAVGVPLCSRIVRIKYAIGGTSPSFSFTVKFYAVDQNNI